MKPIVGLDLDDVLKGCYEAFFSWHNARYGTRIAWNDITSYRLEEVIGCETQTALDRVSLFYRSRAHDDAWPIAGASDVIEEFKNDVEFVVITSRPESIRLQTCGWVARHFPALARAVTFTNHHLDTHRKRSKREVCAELGVILFVDDHLHHVRDVSPVVETTLLMDAPWNRHCAIEAECPNACRVHSWDDIRNHLELLV